jgi:hypothetical protein
MSNAPEVLKRVGDPCDNRNAYPTYTKEWRCRECGYAGQQPSGACHVAVSRKPPLPKSRTVELTAKIFKLSGHYFISIRLDGQEVDGWEDRNKQNLIEVATHDWGISPEVSDE